MAKCAQCGKKIAFGGKSEGEQRFCGAGCQTKYHLARASSQLPDEFVREKAAELHSGTCPKCGGSGPVDVHIAYSVWSAGIVTRWSQKAELSCRPCGNKAKLKATAFSGLLGWWGIPWGLFITPAQIIRNLGYMARGTDPSQPSEKLIEMVRTRLSAQLLGEDNDARKKANAVETQPS